MKQRKDTKSNSAQGSKNRPTKGHATTAERLEVLKRYYVNSYSIQLLANQYQVASGTIRNWIRTFEQENPEVAKAVNKKRIPPQGTSSEELSKDDYVALKARILELEKALDQACLERDVFKTCLEVYGEEQKKWSLIVTAVRNQYQHQIKKVCKVLGEFPLTTRSIVLSVFLIPNR